MDIPDDHPIFDATQDYIVAFGHLKLIKDRISNDKAKKDNKDTKKPISARLPRTVRSITSSIKPKNIGQTNITCNAAGTSRQIFSTMKMKTDTSLGREDKFKPSQIPRRRFAKEVTNKEPSIRIVNKNITSRQKPFTEPRNIQRVQLLNVNPDFNPEPPKPVTIGRPIPTLGQIYRQNLSNDTLTDWYLESVGEYIDTPQGSALSNATVNIALQSEKSCISNEIKKQETSSANQPNNLTTEDSNATASPKVLNETTPLKIYNSTDENVTAWISLELDQPTKDDESGYRSMSPPRKAVISTKANNSTILRIPHDEKNYIFDNNVKKSVSTTAISDESNSDFILPKRATVVLNKGTADSVKTPRGFNIPKVNTDVKLLTSSRSDIHKPLKYHSTPNSSRKRENFKIPVPSYVEFPSEVLQKTTSFETDDAHPTGRGLGYDNTSQWTLGLEDTYSGPTDDTVWSQLHSPQESVLQSSKNSHFSQKSWRENDFDDKNELKPPKSPDKYSHHEYFNHYCWRKEVVKKDFDDQYPWDYIGRCKICQKCRQAPSRKKAHQPFQRLKNCFWRVHGYKGLNRVWKKTTERWRHWARTTYGCGKLRMNNFKKSLIWDNAHVQTTILAYRETGTDAVTKEQKSAAITTSLKLSALPMRGFYQNGSSTYSAKLNKSPIRHVNIGPSMFPFLYYPTSVLNDRSMVSRGARHSSENKLKELRNINSLRVSKLKNKSNEGNHRSINKSTSLLALPSYVLENGTVTETVPLPVENKVTSTLIHFSDIKLADTVSQDAYTQMCVTCNNAAADIKYTPVNKESTKITKSTDEEFYYGVDRGTSVIPPINISQRSIPIMTSKGIMQELTHKETQVSPTPSTRKVPVVLPQEKDKDAKSSVVTETTVPCRRFESTLVTTKGTILSCTGTKVTSMSSAQIQTASEASKMSRGNAVNTATSVSRNFATKNTDCLTALSLHRSYLEDVSLGTDELPSFKSEKSTSYTVLKTFADFGVSTSNVVDRASYNRDSCGTKNSFCTVIHPECSSVCINTDVGLNSKSTGTGISFENRNKSTIDCHAQYSEPSYGKSNDTWDNNSRYLARIGRSRLMSVRMLSDSVTEMATQAQPVFQCAETNTAFKQKMSASVFTSRYAIGEPLQSTYKLQPKDTGPVLTCHCPSTGCDSKTIFAKEGRSQALTPVRNDVACKTNSELKSVPRLTTRNGVEARQAAPNAEPNFVISSNLNATKWMKGCTKESEKDVQSIISISETMVAESLDRASLIISRSKDRQSINDANKLSKVLINHQPDVGCITTTGYHPSSSFSIARMLPTKDENSLQDQKTFSKHSENDAVIVNKMTSDDSTTKAIKESIPQLRSNLTDAGTSLDVKMSKQQSASVITSRHILPYPPRCSHTYEDIDRDCIFVYDRPRCVVHSFLTDATVQTDLLQPNSEIPFKKHGSVFNRSVGRRSSCSHHNSHTIGEVLSPKVYKALYETTKLMAKKGSESSIQNSSTTMKEESETTTPRSSKTEKASETTSIKSSKTGKGSETTSPKSSKTEEEECETTTPRSSKAGKEGMETPTPKSNKIGKDEITIPTSKSSKTGKEGNITPRIIKTGKEEIKTPAPKSCKTRKEGIEIPTTKNSVTQPIPIKTENEEAIAASRLQSKAVSQMTSCLLTTPVRYYCARCLEPGNVNNRSIQTIEPLLLCLHCNARLLESNDLDRAESMKNQSIQAVDEYLLHCPQCRAKVAVLPHDSRHEAADCMQSYLMASCRYYSNLLSIKLAEVKNNFLKYKAPSIEEAMYHAIIIPNNFNRTPTNITFTEACTMKPSGRKDENCEAIPYTKQLHRRSILYQATSLTDVRGNDKNDLKDVYCILTAIEGRVRRLKSNLTS